MSASQWNLLLTAKERFPNCSSRHRSKESHMWLRYLCLAATLSAAVLDTRLIDAVKAQDPKAVSALLQQNVNVDASGPDGATALHWAAYLDDVASAELLVGAGAKVGATNIHGVTPLSLACTNGSAKMVALLLKAGADAN